MSGHQTRARILLETGRPRDAEAALREGLAEDMENFELWHLLVQALVGQNKLQQAVDAARKCVALEPELDVGHYALARALLERGRRREARTAVEEAIRLSPEDADNFALLARIHWEDGSYRPAMEAARKGLEFDADEEGCRFYYGLSQSRLGEHDAADSALRGLLADDPEDKENHAARGYQLLDRGDRAGAKRHFLEALRLDSSHTGAREGLAEALKARNPLFAILLRMNVWASRFGWKGTAVLIAALIGLTELLKWGRSFDWIAPVCMGLLLIVWMFVMVSVASNPLFSLLLLLDREGRHALSRRDKAGVLWCLPLLALAGWEIVRWMQRGASSFPAQAMVALCLTDLVWETFQAGSRWVRRRMALIAMVCVAAAGAAWFMIEIKAAPMREAVRRVVGERANLSNEERDQILKQAISKEKLEGLIRAIRWSLNVQLVIIIVAMTAHTIRQALERRSPDGG